MADNSQRNGTYEGFISATKWGAAVIVLVLLGLYVFFV
ncbi:MAG: aa3-type cytochrome c oxidase subunit IV [Sphingomonadales bacterium]|jgi:hypothetical protein